MEYAKCAHSNASRLPPKQFVTKTDRPALLEIRKNYCSTQNYYGDCPDYDPQTPASAEGDGMAGGPGGTTARSVEEERSNTLTEKED